MALATRCPNCQALFRVVADQLKLRGGLVRCGACRHVFDAIGSLTYVDETAPAQVAPARATAKPAPVTLRIQPERTLPPMPPTREDRRTATAAERRAAALPSFADQASAAASEGVGAARASADDGAPAPSAPTLRAQDAHPMPDDAGVEDGGRSAPADADDEVPDGREQRGRSRRWRSRDTRAPRVADTDADIAAADAEDEAPAFLRSGHQRTRTGFSVVFGGGSVLLAALLLTQLAVAFRSELATRWPPLRPALVRLCEAFDCTVGWPARADLLAVVGSELQSIPGTDVLELTAVVRNRANFRVALPAIELTLTDTRDRMLARKVFAPVDYLASAGEPSSRIDEGIAAGADYTIRIAFEARGIAAAGFVVYPFYL